MGAERAMDVLRQTCIYEMNFNIFFLSSFNISDAEIKVPNFENDVIFVSRNINY